MFFFFKQKTAYEMRISDWSSDVCSSDLPGLGARHRQPAHVVGPFAADRAIEVIERAVVIDDRRLVRVFLVDRSRRADIDQHLVDLPEIGPSVAERDRKSVV